MKLIQWKAPKDITIYPPKEPHPDGNSLTEELNYSLANLVVYMYHDHININMGTDLTTIELGGEQIAKIMDVNTETAYITENVDAPEGEWFAEKYFYTPEDGYTLNEYWVDPRSIDNT